MISTILRFNQRIVLQWRKLDLLLTAMGMIAVTVIHFYTTARPGSDAAYVVMVLTLFAAGLLQYFWLPQTQAKQRLYVIAYHLVGVLACVYFGFNTLFIIGWLLLMIVTGLTISQRAIVASFGTFIAATLGWWTLHNHESAATFLIIFLQALLIGVVALVVSQIIEISRRRGRELEVSRRKDHLDRERLVALVNSMGDAVIAINEKAEIRIYNAAASSLLDTNVNLVGKRLGTVLHLCDGNRDNVDLGKLLKGVKASEIHTDLRHRFADKEMINLYLNISPIHLGYQRLGERGYILIMRDITKEKSLEQERDEFISVVGHELRTPIAIAEGSLSNARVLQHRNVGQAVIGRAIDEAYQQVMYLSKMANNLATLSRAERGVHTTEIEPIDLYALLDELYKNYEKQALEKRLRFSTKAIGHLEPLATSRLYVQEILQNFITNAIKYTKEGSVKVTAQMDGHHRVIFTVHDTGIGISKSDQAHLFEKFFRSEDYRTRESSGTGLGLYLVQKLTQQLGATISLKSRLNHGSTFTIVVPPLSKKAHRGDM